MRFAKFVCYAALKARKLNRLLSPNQWVKGNDMLQKLESSTQMESRNGPFTSQPRRQAHLVSGEFVSPAALRGLDYLKDWRLNKGLAYSMEERQMLGLHGLLPPAVRTIENQTEAIETIVYNLATPTNIFFTLLSLHRLNQRLFYRFISDRIEKILPPLYLPGMATVAKHFGYFYQKSEGLYVTIRDRGHIYDIIRNWPDDAVRIVCVTDGKRTLTMGDMGVSAMAMLSAKLPMFTVMAHIKPHHCMGIALDVGTDNMELLNDQLYVGLRQKRVHGKEYDDFIEEFMQAVVKRFGAQTFFNLEKFGLANASEIVKKYKKKNYCIFNDDVQGCGVAILGGIFAALRILKMSLQDCVILIVGDGGCATGTATMVEKTLVCRCGVPKKDALRNVYMMDPKGLLTTDRKDILDFRKPFAKKHKPIKTVEEAIKKFKPHILIGASSGRMTFSDNALRCMGGLNKRPVIFALSFPSIQCECSAEQTYKCTDGRAIFSTASFFPPVVYNGKTFRNVIADNIVVYPGIALGVVSSRSFRLTDEMFLLAADELGNFNSDEEIKAGALYPKLSDVPKLSLNIGTAIAEYAYKNGFATVFPKPKNKRDFIKKQLYDFNYSNFAPKFHGWPKVKEIARSKAKNK